MRILQVRFKNLNSLAGEWLIDFTHPAFTSDGIFAITGPTGAGKSTILDAICLALYGRTPRLNRVTKSVNDIMSRQTGECFAEVTFETQSGRFRCHWSQHRARRRADGELQAPRHEIADADTGRIFEAKLRGVAEQIETATGMDFDRFTRSMLLAQGGFDAFLKADPDNRAPILEQITGTEIYSHISMRVHELRAAQRKQLELLQAELAGMALLSVEDEQQLRESLEQQQAIESGLTQQREQHQQAIHWLEGIERLEHSLQQVEAQQLDWRARHEAFLPALARLERANQALELQGAHAELLSLRREQQAEQLKYDESAQMLPQMHAALAHTERAVQQASVQLENQKAEQKAMQWVSRDVRALDIKLHTTQAAMLAVQTELDEQQARLGRLQGRQSIDGSDLAASERAFEQLSDQLVATQADEGLVEDLGAIRQRVDALKALQCQQQAQEAAGRAAEAHYIEATQAWDAQQAILAQRHLALAQTQQVLTQKQDELKHRLEGRQIAEWHQALADDRERKQILDKVSDSIQIRTAEECTQEGLVTRQTLTAAEKTAFEQQLQRHREQQAALVREKQLLETQHALLKRIHDLDEARQSLQDGEPCPLCGAHEHPYAEGNIPAQDDTTAALQRVRDLERAANDVLAELRVNLAKAEKDMEHTASEQTQCSARINNAEQVIGSGLKALAVDVGIDALAWVMPHLLEENSQRLAGALAVVQTAEVLEQAIAHLRQSLDQCRESLHQTERETQAAAHYKEAAVQNCTRLRDEGERVADLLASAQHELAQVLAVYGVDHYLLDGVVQELTTRRERWLERQQKKTALQQQMTALAQQIRHQAEQLAHVNAELVHHQQRLSELQRQQQVLAGERFALFADRQPDDEEARLAQCVEQAEAFLDEQRQTHNQAAQQVAKLTQQIESLTQSMAVRAGRVLEVAARFEVRLTALDFADEAAYLAACLPEDERKQRMQQHRQLTTEQTELESRARDIAAQLAYARQRGLSDSPRDQLAQTLDGLMTQLRDLQQAIGANSLRLKDNELLRQQQHQRVQAVDAQKCECMRWDMLHELIGSADGKKYRNFAQGLTFEMMIGHANRQLQKMTDRYLLIRDVAQPLELNVIDNYQAGEIRSTKNLSGGESFIVSLSLALGLSHMASKNVRVDSLFLDEGFGTLDEEALETALETLAGLQQDGKLIGVISHVAALKERISAQIQISPQAGGRSVVSGPGCRRGGGVDQVGR